MAEKDDDLTSMKVVAPSLTPDSYNKAIGKVTAVHESKMEGNKGDRSVTIQITALSLR